VLRSAKIAPVFDYPLLERFWKDADDPSDPAGTEEVLGQLGEYEAAGAEHIVFSFYSPPDRALLESVAPR